MSEHEEGQAYLDRLARERGYAHRSHRLLARHDLDALKAVNPLTVANYVARRTLDEPTKELLLIAAFAALRAPGYIVGAHVKKAHALGATPRQTLEALEMVLPEAGRAAFQEGLAAWRAAGTSGP